MKVCLFSSPEEKYSDHINLCLENFKSLFAVFEPIVQRALGYNDISNAFRKMITYHDLGKLTERWQDIVNKEIKENKNLHKPSHSSLGAAYLWRVLPDDLKEPISFAVAIHHTDRGLLGDNIEKPDVQAITDNIADFSGRIKWFDKDKRESLAEGFFPNELRDLYINDLKEMARGLRKWAKGCSLPDQHKRRLQASLCHHLLKLCDISAASNRRKWEDESIDEGELYGGWLMVKDIKDYVSQINERMK